MKNYEEKLSACKLVMQASTEEDRLELIRKNGEPSVTIPQFMSEWKKEMAVDPFNEATQYDEDEDGKFEVPCAWIMGWN